MKKDPILENLWLFERYTGGEMDEGEREAFENRLKEDNEIKEAFEEYKQLYEAISDKEALELRRKLIKIEKEYRRRNDRKGGASPIGLWYWLAATLIIAGGITILLMTNFRTPWNAGRQYADYFAVDSLALKGEDFGVPGNYYFLQKLSVRSSNFSFYGPRDSAVFYTGERIKMRWELKGKRSLTLQLFDNKGNVLYRETSRGQESMVLNEDLMPGVYVYQISIMHEIHHVGLFFVVEKPTAE